MTDNNDLLVTGRRYFTRTGRLPLSVQANCRRGPRDNGPNAFLASQDAEVAVF